MATIHRGAALHVVLELRGIEVSGGDLGAKVHLIGASGTLGGLIALSCRDRQDITRR